jgi:chromosome segregation ATPase
MERITSKIENQNEMILNAQRAVAETEEVGNDIVEELKGNREKIVSVRDKTTELNANVDDAATRLDSMQRREKCVIS